MDGDATLPVNKALTHLPNRPPVNIDFQDISYSVPSGKKSSKFILRGISGKFSSGQLTAILGPSGAGKSTLLNILAGYKCDATTGTILVNGKKRKLEKFMKVSRYITQNDYVQPYLTVQESMKVAANLKLGSSETQEDKNVMINEIQNLLRLTKCKNTIAKGLSGGEKKRLSIALELLNNPPVIFLDEPTTGLDDAACTQCIGLLKLLASGGRTVICVLHTPSAKLFSLFDNVYMLSQGQCVYQGYGPTLVSFLENLGLVCPKTYSPVDFMMEVCCNEYGNFHSKMVACVENGQSTAFRKPQGEVINDQIEESVNEIKGYSESESYSDVKDVRASFLHQVYILTLRMWIQIWRDKSALLLKIIVYLALGLLIGVLYSGMGHDGSKTLFNFGFLYVCIIFFMFIPMMPVLLRFPLEIKILKREHFNKWYGLGAYYVALTISTIPAHLILTGTYVVITYLLSDQPREPERMYNFYFVCVLTGLVAESMGLLLGAMLSIVNALFLGTCVKVPLMLLATYGFGSGAETIPGWIRFSMYFSYLRYSMEALMTIVLRGRPIIPCPEDEDWCIYTDVSYFLKIMGMENCILWLDILVLVGFLVIFKFAGYYMLKQRLAPNRLSKALSVVAKLVKSHFGP